MTLSTSRRLLRTLYALSPLSPHTIVLGSSVLAAMALLGCGTGPVVTGSLQTGSQAVQGRVYGGQQPVTAARIQLYAVGTTGDGSASTPLLTVTVTSSDGSGDALNANANAGNGFNSFPAGSFSISGDYTCPSNATQVYLTATGGNPGITGPANNAALAMLAFLGPCGNLGPNTYINMNELTTVGSLAPLAPYLGGFASIGSGPSDAAQFQAALNLVSAYTNTATGTVPGPDLPPGYYASSLEITTLADIIAACVNSDGNSPACQQLFQLTTPPGGSAPADTVAAIASILRNPTLNVAAIFNLLSPTSPFQPTLTAAPQAWTVPILPLAAAPAISPASGTYSVAPTVTLSDTTPGATIYYTVDGSTPTTASAVYSRPFNFSSSSATARTVKAFALASGFAASTVSSATYTLPPAGSASSLSFLSSPVTTPVSTTMPTVRVGFVDAYGTLVARRSLITLALGSNPSSATLRGTLNVVAGSDGSASFTDLSVSAVGQGYTLVASSSGFPSATSTGFDITTPPIAITTPGTLIGTGVTLPGTFTLPTAAPTGGATVTLTSSNPSAITISPATVALNAGDTTGSFTYTAVGSGATTLRASAPNYTDGTNTQTTTANFISLGTLPTLTQGTYQNLALTLSTPAPAGGLTVALSSSNTSVLFVTTTATFAAGATTPTTTPQIQAKAFGAVQLTATAAGYAPDARNITLSATASLTQNLSVARYGSAVVTLTLSQAPTTALTFTLKSDNTAVATVPSLVTLPANATTVTFNATGAGVGSTTLHASASGLADATTTIAVTGTLTLTNGSPAAMLYVPATLTLSAPAVTPVSITLTSSNPAALLLSADPNAAGAASITLPGVSGSSVTFYEQGQAAGSSTVTMTSAAYTTVSAAVTVYAPTLVVQPGYNTTTVSSVADPVTLDVLLGEVNPSNGVYVAVCAAPIAIGNGIPVAGCKLNPGLSLSVAVLSSNTTVGTITSSPVTITAGNGFAATGLQPLSSGNTTISLGALPAGFTALSSMYSAFSAQIVQPTFTLPNTTYETAPGVTLPRTGSLSVVDTRSSGTTVTVAIANGALAAISTDPTVIGTASVTLTGITNALPTLYLQGFAVGQTTITYSAPGYASVVKTLYVGPASVGLSASISIGTTTSSAPTPITLILNIDSSYPCYNVSSQQTYCFLSPTTSNQFTINSSDPNIGAVSNPLVMAAQTGFATGTFQGFAAGTITLTVGTPPAPLAAPATRYGPPSTTATVTQSFIAAQAANIGVNLYNSYTFNTAVASARNVTITSSNPAIALVSLSATALGSASVTIPNYAGGNVTYYVQGVSAGTATLSIAASGFASTPGTITVLPSGIVFNPNAPATFTTTAFASATTVGLYVATLNATTGAPVTYCGAGYCLPNPGVSFSIPVSSSKPAVGTVSTSSVTFAAGAANASFTFLPNDVGTTTLSLGQQPTGLSTGAGTANAGVATVTGSTINLANLNIGAGVYASESMSFNLTPPVPLTVTVSVADPSLAKLSTDPAVMGASGTLTFPNVTCGDTYCSSGGPPLFYVQGVAPGYTKLTVSVRGYYPSSATVAVNKVGLTLYTVGTQFVTGVIGSATQPNAAGFLSLLDPYSLSLVGDCNVLFITCTVNPGMTTPSVTLTTADPSIGTFGAPGAYNANGAGFEYVPYVPVSPGQTTYSLGVQAPGYYNTTTQQRKTGLASTRVTGNAGLQNSLYLLAHDIDAGVGIEVPGDFGYSATVIGYNTNPLTVTVADPTIAVVSTSPTVAGSGAFNGTYTDFNNTFYVQGLKAGTTTITFSENQYISRTITVTVRPAGFVIKQYDSTVAVNNRTASIAVMPAVLNDAGQWMANAQLNPQTTGASVQIASSAPGVATVPATVTFAAAATSATATVQLVSAGTSTFTLGAASAAFTTPTTYQSVAITAR